MIFFDSLIHYRNNNSFAGKTHVPDILYIVGRLVLVSSLKTIAIANMLPTMDFSNDGYVLIIFFCFKGPDIIYVEEEGKKEAGGGGGGRKGISDWLKGGTLNFLIKKFGWVQQFDRWVYFKRGPLAKMGKAVK